MFRSSLLLTLFLFTPLANCARAQPSPNAADVIVNEIMYAPSPATNEFIELYNRSSEPINLGRLEFADANRSFFSITETDTTLGPDSYVVLVRDPVAFEAQFPSTPYVAPNNWDALNNGGDTVLLRDGPSETVLDSVPYDPAWGGDSGASLERIDPQGPSDQPRNFGTAEIPSGGTPGAENSIYAPDVTPPALERTWPSSGGDSLIARFSEPLAPSSVGSTEFHLTSPDAPVIAAAVISDTSDLVVHCVLAEALEPGRHTLVAEGVEDRRGNVQNETRASFHYFVPDVPAPKDLVVSEIHYAPTTASNEFVEIYNRSDKTVDVGTLEYADENRNFARVTTRRTPLRPDSHAVFVRDPSAFETAFPTVSFYSPDEWDTLNNGGDTVVLRHGPTGSEIDAVPYSPSWGNSDGRSLERIDPAGPSDAPSNFGSSTAADGATPGRRNSLFDPDESAPSPVFAEQVGDRTVEVTFSEVIRSSSLTPSAFDYGSVGVSEAVLTTDSIAVLTLTAPPTATEITVEHVQDRVGNTAEAKTIPLALQPDEEEIVINEILFDPRADSFDNEPDQVEYVELLNLSDKPLTLNGLVLTDRPNEDGIADTIHAGHRIALRPHGFGVVVAAPNDPASPSESQLADAFPNAPLTADSTAFLSVDGSRLGLTNEGDRIRIHRADGAPIGEVQYSPDWHAAGLEETQGTALERISPTGRPESADNWTSSTDPSGGTPGMENAVSLPPPGSTSASKLKIAPSPFSIKRDGATRIRYVLDDVPNLVRARVFDARGRKVRTLEDARLAGRTGELVWNGRDDAGNRVRVGVYVILFEAVRAEAGSVTELKKPVVVARPLH